MKKHLLNSKLKLLLLSCLVVTFIIAAKQLNIQGLLHTLVIWVESLGIFGPIAYIIIYNLATLLFIPGSLLTLKGGCLFGVFWGSIYVLIAAIIGATLAFVIGRYLSQNWVRQQMDKHPKFKAIDLAVAKEGWKIVLLTRLSPVFPFNLLNYAFGVTQVSLKDYILGSLGIIPGTVMYVYIGSLAGNLAMINTSHQLRTSETQIWEWIMQGVGLVATVAVTIYITKIAQKALDKSVAVAEITNDETQL
ncbi:TVP38/TMEM64 family protein [Nostoc sp. UCD121]|uniref:TVP38/TMEM64 family protein n=1 Tax=unclassified Nostoc TaxID=2593658 RepID=UPI00162385BE|nr:MULTISPECIES: TVP38/TMEM64 family protein [unclassified Nostoc]MBC1221259.1 TVP38/TMEM64 family protein [Nostoc sp. UCD120]MBC1278338.1 TVP38/TMEM64 family protein [Nostoc sp. UCD121]MBC1297011.1 TVP38/TMEM64 family protein [Nostoc sp. UCD122]